MYRPQIVLFWRYKDELKNDWFPYSAEMLQKGANQKHKDRKRKKEKTSSPALFKDLSL